MAITETVQTLQIQHNVRDPSCQTISLHGTQDPGSRFQDTAKNKVHLALQGKSFQSRESVLEIYRPLHQNYSDGMFLRHEAQSANQDVEYWDLVTTWKGLSVLQAYEIDFWEKAFKKCLEELIKEALLSHFSNVFSETILDKLHEPDRLRILHRFVVELGCKTITVDIDYLVYRMINCLHVQGEHHGWLLKSGDLEGMLLGFLTTRDCFFDETPQFPSVCISFTARLDQVLGLGIIGDVAWNPPRISFKEMKTVVQQGSWFTLAPWYDEPVLQRNRPGLPVSDDYCAGFDQPWLSWNPQLQVFDGVVPFCYGPKHQLGVSVCAVIVKHLHGVRFERVLRCFVRLSVIEPPKPSTDLLPAHCGTCNGNFGSQFPSTPRSKTTRHVEDINEQLSPVRSLLDRSDIFAFPKVNGAKCVASGGAVEELVAQPINGHTVHGNSKLSHGCNPKNFKKHVKENDQITSVDPGNRSRSISLIDLDCSPDAQTNSPVQKPQYGGHLYRPTNGNTTKLLETPNGGIKSKVPLNITPKYLSKNPRSLSSSPQTALRGPQATDVFKETGPRHDMRENGGTHSVDVGGNVNDSHQISPSSSIEIVIERPHYPVVGTSPDLVRARPGMPKETATHGLGATSRNSSCSDLLLPPPSLGAPVSQDRVSSNLSSAYIPSTSDFEEVTHDAPPYLMSGALVSVENQPLGSAADIKQNGNTAMSSNHSGALPLSIERKRALSGRSRGSNDASPRKKQKSVSLVRMLPDGGNGVPVRCDSALGGSVHDFAGSEDTAFELPDAPWQVNSDFSRRSTSTTLCDEMDPTGSVLRDDMSSEGAAVSSIDHPIPTWPMPVRRSLRLRAASPTRRTHFRTLFRQLNGQRPTSFVWPPNIGVIQKDMPIRKPVNPKEAADMLQSMIQTNYEWYLEAQKVDQERDSEAPVYEQIFLEDEDMTGQTEGDANPTEEEEL